MAPLSLKVVLDEGAVTRTVLFDAAMTVEQALAIVKEKMLTGDDGKEYGLFLTSADDERSGIWLERHRNLEYYMLRDGDHLHYLCRMRNVRIRMLDGSVKTLPVDESKTVAQLMVGICARIGIMNHEEYGLCHDEEETAEEKPAPGMGTLTRKRMAQPRERDAKLEQLSKKLKTDDNVEWLDQHKTFREMGVGKQTLLLKRRLFYTDCNVDARDPVGLNLLYVQTRDAVLEGHHPVTEDQALQFAGIQCQIQYGDFHEDKHKPGLIDVTEFLPKERTSSRGMESKILKEHRKHQGLSEVDAKLLYIKTARDLPTFGVTFFLVKEKQKGKKKLVPRLLGINKESILRLDENTKEILQVWPLTQVKTYHAGKSETFTLNFGDYSDKEYSVKTNDAHRIRDILQSYIDIIKRRLDAQHQLSLTEHHAIVEDHVEASRGHFMERITHNPSKIVQETFVGPSKIVSYEPGQQISQGTQIVTVQQIVVTGKGSNQQTVMMGQIPARKDMPMDFVRKLNRLNSNSVKIVTFLTEPTDGNVLEAQKLVESMNSEMASIEEGVTAAAQQQGSEDAKKKLLDELRELRDCMKALTDATVNNVDPEQGQEAARNVADLSTQIYFSVDPRTVKRGAFCRRSRNSFIQDERTDASLRRASLLAASQSAVAAADHAREALDQDYEGPTLDPAEVEELEKAAEDKIGKLSAAVALYLTANSDPKNIDYSAAVNSMNTINELLPELTKDATILSGVKDGKSRQEFLDDLRALCDAAKAVCLINKPEDHEKLQDAAADYGRKSEKLLFTFKRMKKGGDDVDKHNQLIELAKEVGDKTALLLLKASELTSLAGEDPRVTDLDDAGVRCADAAKDLLTCANLTASSIHEPHCQSAVTAAAETLASRAQHLASSWKPLVDEPDRKHLGEDLKDRTFDLAKALDRLRNAFAGFNEMNGDDGDTEKARENRRLKFITTVAGAKKGLDDANAVLDEPYTGPTADKLTSEELKRKLVQRIAQLNAALAALVAATADRDKPDYATADLAVATISEVLPEIVKDGKAVSSGQDEASRAAMLADLRALCDAARHVCAASEHADAQGINDSASKLANSSGKLFYVFNPRADQDKEHEIIDLSSGACQRATVMLAGVRQLEEEVGGDAASALDEAGSRVADAANALLAAAQLTAPCMSDPRCQAALSSSADALRDTTNALAAAWAPVVHDPRFQQFGKSLEEDRQQLLDELERLKKACLVPSDGGVDGDGATADRRRLQFISSAAAADRRLAAAEAELEKPAPVPADSEAAAAARARLARALAQLSAAVAALRAAHADRDHPDYAAANRAIDSLSELLPGAVQDARSAGAEGEARALLAAARRLCAAPSFSSAQELDIAAGKFAEASNKLMYRFNPRATQDKENEIVGMSRALQQRALQLQRDAHAAAAASPAHAPLATASSKLADAADALCTTAQLTSSSLHDDQCQASLIASVDSLSGATYNMSTALAAAAEDPRFHDQAKKLEEDLFDLRKELDRLKKACHVGPNVGVQVKHMDPVQERQRLQFVGIAADVDRNMQKIQKELDKPLVACKPDQSTSALQSRLARALAQLNAALAALLVATSDRDKPNYDEAEQAIQVINQLMPQVVKDTRTLSASKEEAERRAMLEELRSACDATRGLCASLRDGDTQEAAKLAARAAKLIYIINPQKRKHQKIIEASALAGQRAAQLASAARHAAATDAQQAAPLRHAAAVTADAAKALLAAAQLTAPCIEEPQSQSALLSATDTLQQSGKSLAELANRCDAADRVQLDEDYKELENALQNLRDIVLEESGIKSPSRRAPPPPPKRTVSRSISNEVANQLLTAGAQPGNMPKNARDFNQEFLNMLRHEESQGPHDAAAADIRSKRKTDDEKALQKQFVNTVDTAAQRIQKAEEDIKKIYSAKDEVIPALSVDQTLVVQKQMEQKLAVAGVAVAELVASNHPDSVDFVTASKATTTLSDVLPHILQDSKLLRGSLNENERKAFLADILALFDATKKLCDSAKDDRKMLDKSAVDFANKSTKLLYVVSTDADPSQEKEVGSRVGEMNAAASRLALRGGTACEQLPGPAASALCRAAGHTAHAATALAYTAKLVGPSIQNADSHEALSKATSNLTDNLRAYSSTWKPLEVSQPSTVKEMRAEAAALEKLLEEFRRDLESGKLVKRRTVERVVVEDTPLRQLACVVLEEAKRRAESTNVPGELRAKYAKYANDLSKSIRDLDLANHRYRQAPHNTQKWQELEYAVQNLQVGLLQARPSQDGRPQDNIVDLTNYVKDVASAAESLKKVCKPDLAELGMVRSHCEQLCADAARVTSADRDVSEQGDDMQDVDHFAEDCDKRCKTISAIIGGLQDGKLKIELQEKATRLSEDCNMLRFASKSALAASQGVSLDATLNDLAELETIIDEVFVPGEMPNTSIDRTPGSGVSRDRLVAATAAAAGAGDAGALPPAFSAYMHHVRAGTLPDTVPRSKDHLKKVLYLLRTLTMMTSRHVATWQKVGRPETAEITGQIIEELNGYEKSLNAATNKSQRSALADVDINKLLISSEAPLKGVKGASVATSEQLQQAASRLWLSAGTAAGAAGAHAGLARSAPGVVTAAQQLAVLAQHVKHEDPAQRQKIDEATKDMSLQTYNLLKAADVVSQDPRNYVVRRRLLDACRSLSDAINKLVRCTGVADDRQRSCGELSRQLQLQQALAAAPPACTLPYAHCLQAMHSQADVLQKLNNEQPMSREEFTRTLGYVNAAVCNSVEYAAQCAYLLSVADQNKDIALEGFVDTPRIINLSEAVQETCYRIIRTDVEQAKAEETVVSQQIQDLQQALTEACEGRGDSALAQRLSAAQPRLAHATAELHAVLREATPTRAIIISRTIRVIDEVKSIEAAVEAGSVAPEPADVSPATKAKCDDILKNSRNLSNNMMSLLREVKAAEDTDPMTWVTFGSRKAVLDVFEALLNSVKQNGKQSGVLEPSQSDLEEDSSKKTYLQVQLDLANKWLKRPTTKPDVKEAGENAAKNIIQLGTKLCEDMKGVEQEEMQQLLAECTDLVSACYTQYDQEKANVLMERLRELKKGIERGVVTRVVEDFLEGEEPLADLDVLVDVEKDPGKRQLMLERKIAELLAQLARVTKTARIVAGAGTDVQAVAGADTHAGAHVTAGAGAQAAAGTGATHALVAQSERAQLLAPALVKAAQKRVANPEDQAAIEHYQKLLAEYAESLANVRSLCDQAVDPMEFVQTAGETMQRMREETNHNNDPQKCAYASMAITKLANRVIAVSMSSNDVRKDPELQKALTEAKERLRAAVPPPNSRSSRIPDWKDTTAEILRTTGEVESVLGGEMIFKKQQGTDQPIFAAAFGLHAAVREWSARDNEIVAVAKRMAVLMAKLSDYMNTDRKRELLATSKAIVMESHEVARLAKKLAHECTDVRIKTNLLQVCERIPTISGQLKMLATVKGSSLGHQGLKEDQEDMIMLVGNAQNLMSSVQEVVKAAASATVKIASQRSGSRMRWVRKTYY